MKTLSLSEVKMKLSQFIEEVSDTDIPLTITRNGQSVAVLLSQELYQGWEETLAIMRDPKFYPLVLENVHQLNRGEGISLTADELLSARSGATSARHQPVRIKILPKVRSDITALHPEVQAKIYGYMRKISDNAESGTLLKDKLDGLATFAIGKYKIIFRLRMFAVEIILVDTRATTYEDAKRL